MGFRFFIENEDTRKIKELVNIPNLTFKVQDQILPIEDKLAIDNNFIIFDNKDEKYMRYTSLCWISSNQNIQEAKKKIDEIWTEDMKKCQRCDFLTEFKALPVGNLNAKYLFIGEVPGITGKGTYGYKRTFVFTETSRLLRRTLYKSNLYHNTFFTNLSLCGLPGNKSVEAEKYFTCMKLRIEKELEVLDTIDTIFLGGNKVLEVFEKYFNVKINKRINNKININEKDYNIISVYHPAFFVYKRTENSEEEYKSMILNHLDNKEKILVYDIEADSTDPQKANLKFFTGYSYYYDKYYFFQYNQPQDILQVLKFHNILISFNGISYDNLILQRFFKNDWLLINKNLLDYWKIIAPSKPGNGCKNRALLIKTYKGEMRHKVHSYSLDKISEFLFNERKKDIDYRIFQKDEWNKEELEKIEEYSKQDIILLKKIHEFMEEYFKSFKILISENDIREKCYIKDKIGVLAYRALCYNCNLPFKFSDLKNEESFRGGLFTKPAIEEYRSNGNDRGIILDIKSAYNHAHRMCNLFSPVNEDFKGKIFTGNNLFPIKGRYNAEKQGIIEKKLTEWYEKRIELLKLNDDSQWAYKTILNVIFGISSNPAFESIYLKDTPGDTTLFCEKVTILMREEFEKEGYKWLYTATDSNYFIDPYKSNEKIFEILDRVKKIIFNNVPFPQDTFQVELQDRFKYIKFFRGSDGSLSANNYLYITEDGRFETVGMDFNDSNATKLGKYIVYEILKSRIINNLSCDFTFSEIKKMVFELLKDNINLMSRIIKVNNYSIYESQTCIEYMISKVYGAGVHELIPNKKFGIGSNIKYCTIEEAKKNNLKVSDLIFDKLWGELKYFIQDYEEKVIKKLHIEQEQLLVYQ